MTRWEPGASDRLRAAALELCADQGFDHTTTAEIAERAGVTERTFFRHFDDKREALFGGQEQFQQAFLDGVAAPPPGSTPMQAVAAALNGVAEFFPESRRAHSRQRGAVIASHPALRERELLKMASLATALGQALRDRGVADPVATLAAESTVTVFRIAYERWLAEGDTRPFDELADEVLAELTALTAPSPLS